MKKISTFLILSSVLFLLWTAFTSAESDRNFEGNWESKVSPQLMTKALRGEQLNFIDGDGVIHENRLTSSEFSN